MPPLINGMAIVSLVLILLIVGLYTQVTKLKEQQIVSLESRILAEAELNRQLNNKLTDYQKELIVKQTEVNIYKQLANQPNKEITVSTDTPEQKDNIPWALIIYGITFVGIGLLVVYRYICFRRIQYEKTINQLLLTKYDGKYYYDFKQKKLINTNQFDEYVEWREV